MPARGLGQDRKAGMRESFGFGDDTEDDVMELTALPPRTLTLSAVCAVSLPAAPRFFCPRPPSCY